MALKLTAKQKLFCEEYVANGYIQVEAYRKAYPDANENTAHGGASTLMKNEKVREYIKELQRDRFEALNISAERIAEKLAEIAFAAKNDEDYTATSQLKALDLLQKQLGLQNQKMEINGEQKIILTIGDEDDA